MVRVKLGPAAQQERVKRHIDIEDHRGILLVKGLHFQRPEDTSNYPRRDIDDLMVNSPEDHWRKNSRICEEALNSLDLEEG